MISQCVVPTGRLLSPVLSARLSVCLRAGGKLRLELRLVPVLRWACVQERGRRGARQQARVGLRLRYMEPLRRVEQFGMISKCADR